MFEIIDDFLSEREFSQVKQVMLGEQCVFPWYFSMGVTENDDDPFFFHRFYKNGNPTSGWFPILAPILTKLEIKELIRSKANLYSKTETMKYHPLHRDYNFSHKVTILYLNTNNGYTIIGDDKIESVENRIVTFDGNLEHRSTTCTDVNYRSNIVINYV